jgi:hypothetical protein
VQEYIDKPFLVDGYKCDMRIYVLVTSCDPLRVFLYHDGLLRMGTEKYVAPMDNNLVGQGQGCLCNSLAISSYMTRQVHLYVVNSFL